MRGLVLSRRASPVGRWAGLAAIAVAGLLAVLLGFPVGASAVPAGAAEDKAPRASLTDIEDEVMCPICGTLLELSESPQAARERVFIKGLIARRETKAQIKDDLVAEYGSEVLALPKSSGFDMSAYLVPILAFIAAAIGLALGIRRWRRATPRNSIEEQPAGPDDEDAKRLDADLARYDL